MLTPLSPRDIPWIINHMHRHYTPAYAYLWHDDGHWYVNTMYTEEKLREEFEHPGAEFFRVEEGGEVYGFCKTIHGKAPKSAGRYRDYFYLQRLYLSTNVQGRGIGSRVMKILIDRARAAGHDALWLETMQFGKARHFYERWGFSWIDRIHLDFPGMIDDLRGLDVMERPLSGDVPVQQ